MGMGIVTELEMEMGTKWELIACEWERMGM